ncbi:MAG TPA: ABC transporter permease subunit [Acidimicrobiales bacterium]|nr:ABC transporter permease subunit [Acidimicrobiales bacterium]
MPGDVGVDPAERLAADLSDRELAGLDALERDELSEQSKAWRVWSSLWPKAAAIGIAVFLWQVVVWSNWKEEWVLPGPRKVFPTLADVVQTADFWRAVSTTMQRALIGFGLSLLIGSVVGAAVVRVRVLRTAVGSMITGLQTMPSIVWFPLAIVLFQLNERAILFVVVLGAAPSIANGLINGVDHVPPLLIRAGNVLGARGFSLMRSVILPAALPSYVGGLKQGWAFAWRSLMAGELLVAIGNKPALGVRLDYARTLSDYPLLISYMIVILIIGIVVDAIFGVADRRVRARRGLLVGG